MNRLVLVAVALLPLLTQQVQLSVEKRGIVIGGSTDFSDAQLQEASKPLRDLFQRFGSCGRCGIPWGATVEHVTKFEFKAPNEPDFIGAKKGCFPLCEKCWQKLESPGKRLPYYEQLFDKWDRDADKYGEDLRKAKEELQVIRDSVTSGN